MSLPFHLDPSVVKMPAINIWTVYLVVFYIFNLIILCLWLKPSAQLTKLLLYQSITTEIVGGDGRRETDIKKCLAWAAFTLVAFLLMKKQIMANAVGVDPGTITDLLWFITGMAGVGVASTWVKERAKVEIAKATGQPTGEAGAGSEQNGQPG
jgi:hypothetical protein